MGVSRPANWAGPLAAMFVGLVLLVAGQGPASAAVQSICSGSVCEEVVHTGGTVTQWEGIVHVGATSQCVTARFWVNGGVIDTASACGTGWVYPQADTPYYLSAGDRLCVTVSGKSGYPCVTL